MGIAELFLLGVGLSMDAFAVAVGKGLGMPKVDRKQCFLIALFFGGFQALMPVIGWFIGGTFASYVTKVDHWIAFFLLGYIGGKMILDAVKEAKEEKEAEQTKEPVKETPPLLLSELLLLAVATSIDALAVGVTFSFLKVKIVSAALIIGCTTFVLSTGGVVVGNRFGVVYKYRAAIAGGVILILLGFRILISHIMGF